MLSPLESALTKNRGRGRLTPSEHSTPSSPSAAWTLVGEAGCFCFSAPPRKKSQDLYVLALFSILLYVILALDEAFFDHLLIAEPQIRDVG
jgi:hypothetical protein